MKVTVRVYANLRKCLVNGEATVRLPEGATVGDLLHHLKVGDDEAGVVLVNGKIVNTRRVLMEGDEARILGLAGGGQ